jgi:hypothetical protein
MWREGYGGPPSSMPGAIHHGQPCSASASPQGSSSALRLKTRDLCVAWGVRTVVAAGGYEVRTNTATRQQRRKRRRFTAVWTISPGSRIVAQAMSLMATADGPCGRGRPTRTPNSHRTVAHRT